MLLAVQGHSIVYGIILSIMLHLVLGVVVRHIHVKKRVWYFMSVIKELGTDIKSTWKFKDGDLILVENDTNLIQAVHNRLNTRLDTMEDYYSEYGSLLHRYLGWRKNETTLKFMQIELEDTLRQDPRFVDFSVKLDYITKGIQINIHLNLDEETEIDMNYVLSDSGTVEEY